MAQVKVDNHAFNATHYSTYSEAEFVKELLPTVSDYYGGKEEKTAFLKMSFAAIKKSVPVEKKK